MLSRVKPYDLTSIQDDNGNVPAYAWPVGYPIYYLMEDCETMCPACVNKNRELIDRTREDQSAQWNVIGMDCNWEDESMYCCNCNKKIESAYGEDDSNAD